MIENGFYPGSTPLQKFTIPYTAAELQNAVVSYEQCGKLILERESEIFTEEEEGCSFEIHLTQEDSLKFDEGAVEIQVNCYFEDTNRTTSDILTIQTGRQLHRAVIE